MIKISKIIGREILDSRGQPTIEADVILSDGSLGRASVPSGSSVGTNEALELRDNNLTRYNGKGVDLAISNVSNLINNRLKDLPLCEQQELDQILIELDGTENKSKIGANAILAVSLAYAKAIAKHRNLPLYKSIGNRNTFIMPTPLMNIINGGSHANNKLDIQEFMIVPVGASSLKEAVRMGAEVFYTLKKLLSSRNFSTNVGDEGGFAPDFNAAEDALQYIMEAIEISGYKPGIDIALALDVAANELYYKSNYIFKGSENEYTKEELVDYYEMLVSSFPIISIEDGMAEHDLEGWEILTKRFKDKIQIVGDDLFVTNPRIIKQYIRRNLANAVLIKPNQIGTLTETIEAINIAKSNGYSTIMSHRSGETEDSIIADLAVALNTGQIKTGSLCRSDRVAKYNQLIRIEEELGFNSKYQGNIIAKNNIIA